MLNCYTTCCLLLLVLVDDLIHQYNSKLKFHHKPLNIQNVEQKSWAVLSWIVFQLHTSSIKLDEKRDADLAAEARKRRKEKPNIFMKIINKEIEADILYEDDQVSISVKHGRYG